MTTKSRIVEPVQGTSSLVRPKYSEGLLLNDDDLTAGVDYTKNLSRLLFRSLFGCGVICGLVVEPDPKCGKLYIHVSDGLALDCRGDPLHVPSPRTITLDPNCGVDIPQTIWVTLCRHDKCCAPRTAICSCDDVDSPSVCTRIRDGYELRILPDRPTCACGCRGASDEPDTGHADPGDPKGVAGDQTKYGGTEITTGTTATTGGAAHEHDCWCVDPTHPCYRDHYMGECSCECGEDCDCDCIILAVIKGNMDDGWTVDHSVRRFIRPVLVRDPVAYEERQHPKTAQERTPLGQAKYAERMAKEAAAKSQRLERDVSRAASNAGKVLSDVQAVAAANEIARKEATATTKAVAGAEKARDTRQQTGRKSV